MILPKNNLLLFLFVSAWLLSCNNQTTDADTEPTGRTTEDTDPLPSWNEGANKSAIIEFVTEATNDGSVNYIPVESRIATFDNDGTLWSEQPAYFQLFFALDRVKAMAPDHPEWKSTQPFKAVLEGDMATLMEQGERGLIQLVMATHSGNTTVEFDSIVSGWIETARHPTKNVPYTDLVFKPMLELISFLQENNFKVFIVSGGGVDFMRPWAEGVYGIPRNQIVGSAIKVKYEYNDGNPVVRKLPELDFIDDKEGKPEGIHRFIGRKPVFAAGNSDGDLQMLRWTDSNTYHSFKLYVHHTDSIREWAYDRGSHIGGFDKGLDEATAKGWALVDMKTDWNTIYPD